MTDDGARDAEIAWLRAELAAAREDRTRLQGNLVHFAAHIHEIRAAFGNPFYYSHPEHPDEGIANYSGGSSHTAGMSTFQEYRRVERDIARLKDRLWELDAGDH